MKIQKSGILKWGNGGKLWLDFLLDSLKIHIITGLILENYAKEIDAMYA